MALRQAKETTNQLDLGDGDYLVVVDDISKRDFNRLIAAMPQDVDEEKGLTPTQGTEFQQALFEILVKGWSLDVPADAQEYLRLDMDSGSRVDAALVQYFGTLQPDEKKEESPETSPRSKPKARA
jgi:hypothetical protein